MTTKYALRELAIGYSLDELYDRVSAATRGYAELSGADWLLIENRLLRVAMDIATLDENDLPLMNGVEEVVVSIAGRLMAGCARPGLPYDAGYLASLAAACLASVGNFSTAVVLSKLAANQTHEKGVFETWMLRALRDRAMPFSPPANEYCPDWLSTYARSQQRSLISGVDEDFDNAENEFFRSMRGVGDLSPSDSLLSLIWTRVIKRFRTLSSARVLPRCGEFPLAYLHSIRAGTPLLFPSQVDALESKHLLRQESGSLVVLPTSTGKSLLGELSLVSSLSAERPIGVYLAPYRALTDQIYERMRVRLRVSNIRCEIRRGGYMSTEQLDWGQRTVLIATPEAFDALLRQRPQLYGRISCCVFDEFHLVEQSVRGLRYEGLVARLKSRGCRLVALSPVVDASGQLLNWLGASENEVVRSRWKPTGRNLAIAGPDRLIRYWRSGDRIDESTPSNERGPWGGTIPFPHQIDMVPQDYRDRRFPLLKGQITENIVELAVDQYRRFSEPILILAHSREQTRQVASSLCASRSLPDLTEPNTELSEKIIRKFPHLVTLAKCLRHGVAYHNAALPGWVKEQLEAAMARRELRVVVATTTLAEGIDLPFRVVIVSNWKHWKFGGMEPMSTLLFRNIAGRCGRAGEYSEGDTIIIDNPGRRIAPERFVERFSYYLHNYVLASGFELKSSIHYALNVGAASVAVDERAALESQFAAYVDSSIGQSAEAEVFVSSLYASQFADSNDYAASVCESLVDDLVGDDEYQIMQRNSPVALTEFGRLCLKTGLSPRTAKSIVSYLLAPREIVEPGSGIRVRSSIGVEWISEISDILHRCFDDPRFVAELSSGSFTRIGTRGFPVTRDNVVHLLNAWASGVPNEEIALISIRNAGHKQNLLSWFDDKTVELMPDVEDWLETVTMFINSMAVNQLSWVLRGICEISKVVRPASAPRFEELASRMECGVRHRLTCELLSSGCKLSRSKLDVIVGHFLGLNPGGSRMRFTEWVIGARLEDLGLHAGRLVSYPVDRDDFDELVLFVGRQDE